MDQKLLARSRSPTAQVSHLLIWPVGVVCLGVLLAMLSAIVHQIVVPPPPHRVILVRMIPLPEGLRAEGAPDSLAPGPAHDFDNFAGQAIDPATHLLFIAHMGPTPDELEGQDPTFQADDPDDIARDGHILVFDLLKQKLVGRVPIPRVVGLAIAPDLHTVFATGSEENRIYSFDELSFTNIHFLQLSEYEDHGAIDYDPVTHRLFVTAPGAEDHATVNVPGQLPIQNENIDPQKENVYILDALTLQVVSKIPIGTLPRLPGENLSDGISPAVPTVNGGVPKFGWRIDELQYDDVTHLVYVLMEVGANRNIRPHPAPPLGTAELVTIDPATAQIIHRTTLPKSCNYPNTLALETAQQIAFIDCTNVDPDIPLVQHVMRMNLKTMQAFPDDPRQSLLAPDPGSMALDYPQHLLFEACAGGITVFDVSPGHFRRLGIYQIGHSTLSIIVDQATQFLYLPVPSVGGRPTLQIAKYNPNGV